VSTLGVFDQRLANFGETPSSRPGLTHPERFSRRGASFAFAYFTGYFGLYELARSAGPDRAGDGGDQHDGLAAIRWREGGPR